MKPETPKGYEWVSAGTWGQFHQCAECQHIWTKSFGNPSICPNCGSLAAMSKVGRWHTFHLSFSWWHPFRIGEFLLLPELKE